MGLTRHQTYAHREAIVFSLLISLRTLAWGIEEGVMLSNRGVQ